MSFKEETIKSKMIYKGRIINLRDDTVKLSNGRTSKREIVEHKGAVAIIALTENNEIVLIRQYRKPVEQALIEIPAGMIKEGEKESEAARRELEEETGYVAKDIKKIIEGFASPGYSTEVLKYYLATDLIKSKQKNDDDENIKVEVVKIDEAFKLIKEGKVKDCKSIIGINIAKNMDDYV